MIYRLVSTMRNFLFLLMIFRKSFERGLCHCAELNMASLSSLSKFFLVVVSNAADKMSGRYLRECVKPRSGKDVANEELREAVEEKGMNGRMVSMTSAEGAEVSKIAIGKWLTIHFLNDGSLCLMCLVKELLTKVGRKLTFQHIADEPPANVCAAAFIP